MIRPTKDSKTIATTPTVWGLTPDQLHDRYWAARGVQVVRRGERSEVVHDAELFLLTEPRTLTLFRLGSLVDRLSWLDPMLMCIRLHPSTERGNREIVEADAEGNFLRFDSYYGSSDPRLARVALTPSRRVAMAWQAAESFKEGWQMLRHRISRARRVTEAVEGNIYDRDHDMDCAQCVRDLVRTWKHPDATIPRAVEVSPGVWADADVLFDTPTRFVAPAWIGAGRNRFEQDDIVGPVALWDDPIRRPRVEAIEWMEIDPTPAAGHHRVAERPLHSRFAKRTFDILFSLFVILLTLPFYPLIMLLIMIEDGRPIFFTHRRESMGRRSFPCLKFRTMRRDADVITARIMSQNQADGNHVFIDPNNDPRLTRIGRFLRRTNIDELPQFFNVLIGQMSVVGPRPSPRKENQGWSAWREARLSVRPGITGLWQVMRTRQEGVDFQEWVKYDLQYVKRASFWLDIKIIVKTIHVLLR